MIMVARGNWERGGGYFGRLKTKSIAPRSIYACRAYPTTFPSRLIGNQGGPVRGAGQLARLVDVNDTSRRPC